MSDLKPLGFWTRKAIALDPRCPFKDVYSLGAALSAPEPGMPRLEPVMRAGGTMLYSEIAVEVWFDQINLWKSSAAERRAANKAAKEAQERAAIAEMQRVNAIQQELLQAQIKASEQFRQERAEYFAQKGWKE